MQSFDLNRIRLPATLQILSGWLLPCILLSMALTWLAFLFSSPKPELPSLPPFKPRLNSEYPLLPDLFPAEVKEDAFAISRMATSDPRLMNAPLSQLPFSVTGILSSANPLKSHAIVNVSNQQFMVSVNDTLEGTSAQVVHIFADRLILAHQDRYEALLLSSDRPGNRQ